MLTTPPYRNALHFLGITIYRFTSYFLYYSSWSPSKSPLPLPIPEMWLLPEFFPLALSSFHMMLNDLIHPLASTTNIGEWLPVLDLLPRLLVVALGLHIQQFARSHSQTITSYLLTPPRTCLLPSLALWITPLSTSHQLRNLDSSYAPLSSIRSDQGPCMLTAPIHAFPYLSPLPLPLPLTA